ncbi:MAG: (d)CMP kinase [Lachnospiraceae bacterium]|nr:(d)CMP kinase [Lachnospiraceae bacterium]
MERFSVAIDGPAGAGKSTIAKSLSKRLGVIYVDTGAMYRAMALHILRSGVDPSDTEAVTKASGSADISIDFADGIQQVLLNGENVSGVIRTEEVSAMASKVSVNPEVRKKLVELQQKLASEKSVVMDGRDIGTVVLPNAEVKIYLTASVEVRAERRYKELIEKGEAAELEAIKAEIRERDERDMNREISPLKQADDAYLLDSSYMSIDEVLEAMLDRIEKKVPAWQR